MTGGLSVDRVSLTYPARNGAGRVHALDRVSLRVAHGEVVAVLGPSGSGKSTLLRAIAGLEPLTVGCVYWNGADLAPVPPHKRGFGLMFQDGQLFQHLSVEDNIGYGLAVQRMPGPERRKRVSDMLRMVDLAGMGNRAVTQLSGGQQQRVALARALAPQPKLLMLDEPLSSLDRTLRSELASELASLLRATGTTAILVTHDEREAERIADRVVRMADGRLTEGDSSR